LAGFEGLRFHASAFQNHGTGPSRYYVGSLASVSGIEALPATRLHEAWLEQAFLDRTLSLRAGKLAADAEFLVSPSATVFLNTTFGWPMIAGADLPSGGPATPFATPGLRAKWNPSEATTLLLGLFNGDPAKQRGAAADLDPQRRNRDGLDVSVSGPPLVIAEIARSYVVPGSGQGTGQGFGPERTGTVKLGYMHHFGRFADLRLDSFGVSLAAPWSTGTGARGAARTPSTPSSTRPSTGRMRRATGGRRPSCGSRPRRARRAPSASTPMRASSIRG
jgi:porin